ARTVFASGRGRHRQRRDPDHDRQRVVHAAASPARSRDERGAGGRRGPALGRANVLRQEDAMFRKILVAYDGSAGARAALRVGIGLAKSLGAELRSISVVEHLLHYAASVGKVQDATERVDEYFRVLPKEARDQAALPAIERQTVIRY